ncbi:MAG: Ig-like domain-containing protein [Gammaproteobacteria bacterium]|nr:Ig-like domain-containing protein [Gammaproteobacteria bacterium]
MSVTVDLVTVTPNPSTTGSYRLSWDGSPLLADRYRVLESVAGGTPSLSYHLGTSAQYSGKASGNYHYLVERCETPLGELEECEELGRAAARVVLPPALTVPATDTDGDYTATWTSVKGATVYELEEQPPGGSFGNIYDEDGTTHEITDNAPGIYRYRARACVGEGDCGGWSSTETTKVPPGVPTLTVPATDADGDYAASWTGVGGATSYELEQQPPGGSFGNIHDEDGTTHEITDNVPGIYRYRARACAGEGNCGDWSSTRTTNVPPGVPTLKVPATDNDGSYSAMWTSPSGATSYELQEKSGSGAWSESETLTATSKTYTTNTPAIYRYRVQACAGTGNCGGWSSIETTKVPPGAPTLTVPSTDADGSYSAMWTSPSGATSHQLREKVGSGAWSQPESLTATSKSYTSNTPAIYKYRVQACAGEGNCGGWSATGTTKVPPGAPSLTVPPSDADGDYAVTWTQPSGATSYQLEEKPAGGTFENIYGGDSDSTNITGRADGTYTYQARACAGEGNCGDWSARGSVSVARTSQPPVTPNTAPVAVDDMAETPFETAVVIAVLDNDTDADGDDLTVTAVTAPADGTATVTRDADGNNTLVTYTPWFNNPGTDVFDYTVSDGTATDTGSVGVRVKRVTVTPNPSTTGIYTLSWSRTFADKYKVFESADGGKTYAVPREYVTNSVQYTGKASGDYSYIVHHCEVPFEDPGGETCSLLGSADVTVLLPPEPTIETGALVVPGNLPYSAGVTKGGDAYVTVPIEPAPGVNGFVPRLAINYGGGRERQRDTESLPGDTLGYGWHLSGFSSVRRCAKNQAGNAAVRMTSTDSLCLDGEPLVLKSGTHFAENAEYRTLRESYRKIVLKGAGFNTWFEITGPDGTVSEYGRTADSRLRNVEYVEVDGISSPVFTAPFLWSVNRQTDAFGNTMVYAYHEDELAGVRYPKEIRYGDDGDARLLFEYVARSDLAAVTLASISQETRVLLHTVRAALDAHSVRTYRMKSETASGRRQLDKIQLCGFAEDSGTTYKCLRPLDIDWEAPPTALPVDKVLLAKVTDPLGRETAFDYGTLTTGTTHDFLFTERPFGNAGTQTNAAEVTTDAGTAIRAVVTAVRRSNGIGGEHTMSYAYQGKGYDSTRNWGFLGFPATRVTDGASGIVTYHQYRLDFPYYAELAAVRQYDGTYDAVSGPADTFDEQLLFSQELAYAKESLSHGSVLPYVDEALEFHYEGGKQIGLTQTESALTLTSGVPTQLTQTTRTAHGETHSGGGTPWGAPPTYTLSEEQRKATTTTKFTNRTSGGKWLIGFANEIRRSDFAGGSSTATRERRTTFTHHPSSNRVDTMERFPADSSTTPPRPADTEHYLRTAYAYDTRGNHLSTTVSGANVASRTNRALFDASEARYPRALRNALGQEHSLVHDKRFGLVKRATDPNNRTTTLAHDPLGREKSRTSPDGVTIATSREWCGTGANRVTCATVGTIEPVARVRTSSRIHPTETRFLDKLGRVVRTEVKSFDGTTERREDVVYDARGRVDRVSQPYHTGDAVYYTDYTYDIRDRVRRVERPDGGDTAIVYDVNPDRTEPDRDHQVRVTVTEKVYKGSTLDATHIKRSLYNVLGELIETTDGAGSAASAKDRVVTTYAYDGSGLLKSATVTGDTTANMDGTTSTVTNATTFEYDVAGARDSVANPNFGTVTFAHTALGELRAQVDSEGAATYSYDKLGRLTKKQDPDGVARWSYDPANAVGALGSRCYHASDCADLPRPNFRETLVYNSDARLETSTVAIRAGGHVKDYVHSYTYDTSGRPATVTYPSGLTVRTDYNARGYRSGLTDVSDTENPVALETFDAMNAHGQVSRQTFGNGVETARVFNAKNGRLTDIDTTRGAAKIQDNTYAWRTNGILSSRLDESGATAKGETFAYDALDRLTSATTQLGGQSGTMNPAERTLSYAYDKLGNLTGRTSTVTADSGLSGTSFGDGTSAPGPNALTGATIGGAAYALRHDTGGKVLGYDDTDGGDDTLIGWNGRSLPETIDVASDAGPVASEAFAYGPDGRRYHRKSAWKDGTATRTEHTFYAGAFEERLLDGHADYASVRKTRVGAGIVQVRTLSHPDAEGEQTADARIEYLHRDHLGSVEAVTDATGARLATLAHDPFGTRRKADWTRSLNSGEIDTLADDLKLKISRGYSDHEHLDRAGFIHMNGRVYDPRAGRFLSPDPVVEDPAFSQSWHSYSYVANSPLSLVDPTGLSFAPCPTPTTDFACRPIRLAGRVQRRG